MPQGNYCNFCGSRFENEKSWEKEVTDPEAIEAIRNWKEALKNQALKRYFNGDIATEESLLGPGRPADKVLLDNGFVAYFERQPEQKSGGGKLALIRGDAHIEQEY